jgi:tetratricopeptide (TPR) repeat protein
VPKYGFNVNSEAKPIVPLADGLWHLGAVNEAEMRSAAADPRSNGLRMLEEKRFAEAAALLGLAAKAAPDDFAVRLGYGRALSATSRWNEAEGHLAAAAKLNPDSYAARFSYGDVLLKVGKFAPAEEEFRAARRLRPWWKKITTKVRSWFQTPPKFRLDFNPPTTDPEAKLAFATARRENIDFARGRVKAGAPNPHWKDAERGRKIHVVNQPIIHPGTKIFAIGSCFALEIRHELLRRGFDVFPKYGAVDFDPQSQILNSLPKRDNINHYDTFTIRQEFEQAFAASSFKAEDFWPVQGRSINKVMGKETVWQDPYRKNFYAADPAGIADLSGKVDACMREGIMTANVYVITLGLIETWLNKANGLHACTYPGVGGGGGAAQTELHVAGFQENYENLKRVCELVFGRFPERHIILTVSPVGLEKTFRDLDVVIANMESKATLRAVAGQICREFPNVHYLPSYELFAYHDLFHDNGRHATRDGVETVLELFGKCFLAPETTPPVTTEAAK